MGIVRNGTAINRVQYQGTYYRNVVRNGTTVFSLSDWNFIGGFASNSITTSYFYNQNFFSPSQVPFGQLSWFLNSNFPVATYGATTVAMVQVYALINWNYTFIRNEYYEIYHNV
jgi:hypothetical protein